MVEPRGSCAAARSTRLWDNAKVLFGDGDSRSSRTATTGTRRPILVSLHPTSERAKETKRELDKCGCSRDWTICRDEHEIMTCAPDFADLCEHLVTGARGLGAGR